ncbi:hypothetical protein AvCA_18130 [Azotobacter vinelandii CA]|uniref:Uncharacterized protein n=2 Tax=Azotobacter vinelandii TaxID=354 RepID=C1DDQ5_AZOVD|nr:hypothetical protein Avin_18130 [Azotobacter vinelandii DJ]AGK16889.1 hypothetical protein AvCA_18130 [Azotobacter vinelandii CA]AGK20182.1 hypothetical protein AvCA6_18130 [Azotobacter vinelandii CA6]
MPTVPLDNRVKKDRWEFGRGTGPGGKKNR